MGSAIASFLDADLAAMLIFDVETLEIVSVNHAARALLSIDDDDISSLADLYAPEELDRLGSALVASPQGWADFGIWAMKASSESDFRRLRTWFGPSEHTQHRLLIAST